MSFTTVAHWSRLDVNGDLVSTISSYAARVPTIEEVGLEGLLGGFIIYGFQRMGIFERDKNVGERTVRSRNYDVRFEEIKSSVEQKICDMNVGEKIMPHLKSFLSKAKNLDMPVVVSTKERNENNILIHKKIGTNRNLVWRAGSTMVYWQLLFDVYPNHTRERILCSCPFCLLFQEKIFPIQKQGSKPLKEKSDRGDEERSSAESTTTASEDEGDKKRRAHEVADQRTLGKRKRV
jgi:hypothetical protein